MIQKQWLYLPFWKSRMDGWGTRLMSVKAASVWPCMTAMCNCVSPSSSGVKKCSQLGYSLESLNLEGIIVFGSSVLIFNWLKWSDTSSPLSRLVKDFDDEHDASRSHAEAPRSLSVVIAPERNPESRPISTAESCNLLDESIVVNFWFPMCILWKHLQQEQNTRTLLQHPQMKASYYSKSYYVIDLLPHYMTLFTNNTSDTEITSIIILPLPNASSINGMETKIPTFLFSQFNQKHSQAYIR